MYLALFFPDAIRSVVLVISSSFINHKRTRLMDISNEVIPLFDILSSLAECVDTRQVFAIGIVPL